jgi:superfamily II DNA or RNA helicase
MVSEGTDIPRLQVCCYLSRIRTELHFRQVLGRILRVRNNETESVAELIIPAHFELLMFAKRLSEEIPESADLIKYCKFDITKPETNDLVNDSKKQISLELDTLYEKGNELQVNPVNPAEDFISARKHKMADTNVGVYGLYIEEVMRYCQ